MKVGDLRGYLQEELRAFYPSEEIESFTVILAETFLGLTRLDLSLNRDEDISSEAKLKLDDAIVRLRAEEPVQYITGTTEFYGRTFKVTPDTLIPRPETEELVDWVVTSHDTLENALDVGTGSGCIAITLAKQYPKAIIAAMDISEKTLDVAKENARSLMVSVNFMAQDILDLGSLDENYDLIVSNPPYVREQEREFMKKNVLGFEPGHALFVPDKDPLIFYSRIARLAKTGLRAGGWLYFEINEYLDKEMYSLMQDSGFQNIVLKKDFRGKQRFIRGQKV